jgi:hypothetical protein
LDVEVVVGEEGLFFEGLADAGSGFRVGGGGEGAAEELERVEVVGTLFERDRFGVGWGLDPCVDDLGEGGFALFFGIGIGFGQAVFEDGREWAEGGGELDILNDFSGLRDGDGLGEAVGGEVAFGFGDGSASHGCAFFAGEVDGGDVVDAKQGVGAFGVDGVVADAAGEFEEGELDGRAVFERRDVEDGVRAGEEQFGVGDGGKGRTVVGVVEVAEFLAAQARRAATVAEGVDVAAGVTSCRL